MSDVAQSLFPVDLQLHSTASDGTDSPTALVELAAVRGVRVLALTDHDSVLGLEEAMAATRLLRRVGEMRLRRRIIVRAVGTRTHLLQDFR